jgi:hypothetical protein
MQCSVHVAPRRLGDTGGIVIGWLTKIVVVAAVTGVAGFDAVSVVAARVGVVDQGQVAARAASESWRDREDVQLAYDTAADAAREANALNIVDPKHFRIADDGTVHLRVEREATTLVLHRISRLRDWATVEGEASGKAAL